MIIPGYLNNPVELRNQQISQQILLHVLMLISGSNCVITVIRYKLHIKLLGTNH